MFGILRVFDRRLGVLVGFAAMGGLAAQSASAQFILPVDQTRFVSTVAVASDDFYYESFDDSATAPDLAPFDVSTSVDAIAAGADSSGSAWQNSMISGGLITAAGGAAGDGEGWSDNGWGRGEGESVFTVVFDISAPATARFVGTVEAYDIEFDSGYAEAILVGPQQAIFAALAFGPDEVVEFDEVFHLSSGSYTLSVFADAFTYGDIPTGLGQASAAYDVSFSVCSASDLDGDGQTGLADLAALLVNYGASGTQADGDLDGDGIVGLQDLAELLANYGVACTS